MPATDTRERFNAAFSNKLIEPEARQQVKAIQTAYHEARCMYFESRRVGGTPLEK